MSIRKQPGRSWRSHADEQIERARQEGAFDDLPGAGKPIPGLHQPYDELWWVGQWVKREQLEVLPPSLAIRRDVERTLAKLWRLTREEAVREELAALNARIRQANRTPTIGPPSTQGLLDTGAVVRKWRERQAG